MLFVAVRDDVAVFRPNDAACPSFGAHLRAAVDGGVAVVARKLRWAVEGGEARAFDQPLAVEM